MKDCRVEHFMSHTIFVFRMTFKLKEYISVNIAGTVIFNLNINHADVYNRLLKT